MNVNAVEAVWVAVNLFAAAVTVLNLVGALGDWRAIRQTNGAPERVAAWANVRREIIRLAIHFALLTVAVPALVRPGETPFSAGIALLMYVSVALAVNSSLDRRTRLRVKRLYYEQGGQS